MIQLLSPSPSAMTIPTSGICQTYLQGVVASRAGARAGWHSNSPDLERWLLENGREMEWKGNQGTHRKSGSCYNNCQRLVSAQLTYCEGFAFIESEMEHPASHAWLITSKGTVWDPSWWQLTEKGRHYFGVSFQQSFLRRFFRERGLCNSILLWDDKGWPVQSGRVPSSEWRSQ